MRWLTGGLPRTAAIALVLGTMSVLPGVGGTAAAQPAQADITYGCRFPSGPRQVKVSVAASSVPEPAAGQATSPGGLTVTVTVPQAALAEVTRLDAATVGATARLAIRVAGAPSTATTSQDLTAPQTALPHDGDLTLVATGPAPAATPGAPSAPGAPGGVAFVAGALDIVLAPLKADGTATDPAAISLACAPAIGHDTAITPGGAPETGTGQHAAQQAVHAAADDAPRCPPPLPSGDFNGDFPLPPIPPGSDVRRSEITENSHACALAAGFSNVAKLEGAVPVGGTASVGLNLQTVTNLSLNYFSPAGIIDANLDPQRATLLTFGFMPVTATMKLTQPSEAEIHNINVVTEGPLNSTSNQPLVATVSGYVNLRLTDARVNGVPLDLGPNCRGNEPIKLVLHGASDFEHPYILQPGGTLLGEITIPPFTGCGAGEDLDPLLTATISGGGNFVRLVQGPLCQSTGQVSLANPCPPVKYGITVNPGGQWTAAATTFSMSDIFATPDFLISCPSVRLTGTFKNGSGLDLPGVGNVTGFTAECTGAGPPLTGRSISVTARGLPWLLDAEFYDPARGATEGHIRGISLHVATEGCSFDLTDPTATASQGNAGFTYVNATHTLTLQPSGNSTALNPSNISGCTSGFTSPIRTTHRMTFSASMVADPAQTITAP